MIKAQELRIGNIINWHGREVVLEGVTKTYLTSDQEDDVLSPEDAEPIPLTSEWLERFGATEEKEGKRFRLKNRLIVVRMGFFVDYGSDVVLKTVHKTQNFIFALTGSELQLKDKTV